MTAACDVTRPANHERAADFFFDIAADQRPWIAAIEGDGRGIAHVSTDALRGRKLFVWGTGRGGERWQEWLSHGGAARYAEIQGGLAPTQFEHLTMPPRSEWAWTEAFGAVSVDPRRSHGADWNAAITHVGDAIDGLVDADQLDEWHAAAGAIADEPPTAVLSTGSGWGALERRRRGRCGRGVVRRRRHAVPRQHPRPRSAAVGRAAGDRIAAGTRHGGATSGPTCAAATGMPGSPRRRRAG